MFFRENTEEKKMQENAIVHTQNFSTSVQTRY
jgi:hypothetical protein